MVEKVCNIVFVEDDVFLVCEKDRIVGKIRWRGDIIMIIYGNKDWRFV